MELSLTELEHMSRRKGGCFYHQLLSMAPNLSMAQLPESSSRSHYTHWPFGSWMKAIQPKKGRTDFPKSKDSSSNNDISVG